MEKGCNTEEGQVSTGSLGFHHLLSRVVEICGFPFESLPQKQRNNQKEKEMQGSS